MLSIIEMSEDESIFYNLREYVEYKDLMAFPMHEFQIIWRFGKGNIISNCYII